MPTNLLANPSFAQVGPNGKNYYNVDDIPQIASPHSWTIGWFEQPGEDVNAQVPGAGALPLPGQDHPFRRPETVVWRRQDAPPEEQALFFGDAPLVLKMFKGWSPIWCWLLQEVAGLAAGNYIASVEVYSDLVASYSGTQKVLATDPLSGELFFVADRFRDGSQLPYGQWNTITEQFAWSASPSPMRWLIDFRGRHGLHNNGVLIRNPSLVRLEPEPTPTPAQPPPTPNPTPDPVPPSVPVMDLSALRGGLLQLEGDMLHMAARTAELRIKVERMLEW